MTRTKKLCIRPKYTKLKKNLKVKKKLYQSLLSSNFLHKVSNNHLMANSFSFAASSTKENKYASAMLGWTLLGWTLLEKVKFLFDCQTN